MAKTSPSLPQLRLLQMLDQGIRCLPASGHQKHVSFRTGEIYYGVPSITYYACERRGWIRHSKITEAGRAVIADDLLAKIAAFAERERQP